MRWKLIDEVFTSGGYEVEWYGSRTKWRASFRPPLLTRPRQTLGSMYASFQEAMDECCLHAGNAPGLNTWTVCSEDDM